MKTDFDAASYRIVDVRQNPEYLAGVLARMHPKYSNGPTYLNDEGEEVENEAQDIEDLSDQMEKGYVVAIVDANNDVVGFSAGAIFNHIDGTKTAAQTYMDVPEGLDAQLIKGLQETQKVDAIFIETYRPDAEDVPEQNAADVALVEKFGGQKVPFDNYRQPLSEGDEPVESYHLNAIFTDPKIGSLDKGELALNHMKALTRLYDPGLKLPYNKELLSGYADELYQKLWPEPVSSLKQNGPRNIFG